MRRVGLIGLGGIARAHARHWKGIPGIELVGYDRSPERTTEFCKQWEITPCDSLEQLMDQVFAVDICTPTDSHRALAEEALGRGLYVLLEKPIAPNLEDCEALVEASRASSAWMMPAQVVRFFADYAAAHRLVQQGAVGRPAAIRTHRGGPAPVGAGGWFRDMKKSGGVLLDLAVHDFDWIRWTFGPVRRVISRSYGLNQEGADRDVALTTLELESGAVAHVSATWMDPAGFRTHFEICGSEGMLEFDTRKSFSIKTSTEQRQQTESGHDPMDDPYRKEIEGFLHAIDRGTPPPVTPEDGLEAVRIAVAAMESARSGAAVVL